MADTQPTQSEQTPTPARQTAVITGASSGIGMATALQFARDGFNVVLAARRKQELNKVATECQEFGVDTLVVPTDTTNDKAVHDLADAACKRFGAINVWVNDAGVFVTGKFQDTPLEDMRRLFDTNFFGYVHGSHAALSVFRRQHSGTLINISSVNAAAPMPYVGVYSASKAAVRALDESLRMELRLETLHEDIHVCTVMPATVDTNIYQNSANYTGQELQAIEPVYDPTYVAKQIVKLAHKPKREIIIGPAGKLLAMQKAHMPGMYEKTVSRYAESNALADHPTVLHDGNLFNPIPTNRGMRGGWREKRVRADRLNTTVAISVAAAGLLAAGVGLLLHTRKEHKHPNHSLLHTLFS